MDIILLLARLLLSVIFLIAGIAKLADREGARRAMSGFGVPDPFVAPLVLALPIAEILVAITLFPLATAWFGSVGALILLLGFLVGIGVNLARGNAPDCHCFGQLHSEPVSWSVFVRNLVLAGIATIIVVQGKNNPGLSAVDWMNDLRAGEAVSLGLSAVAVALLIPTFVMLRKALQQQTTMLETVTAMKKVIDEDYAAPAPIERAEAVPPTEGLPVGAPAPAFTLASVSGGQIALDDLLAFGQPVLLLFVSPNCSPCKSLLPFVRAWQRDYSDQLTVAVLTTGEGKEVQLKMAKYEARNMLLQGNSSVSEDYRTRWTPSAVLIDRRGKIASSVAAGDKAIHALLTETIANNEWPAVPQNGKNGYKPLLQWGSSPFQLGEPAPRFSLRDLHDQAVTLDDLLGRETMLLFWHPRCQFCKDMIEDLRKWEEHPPAGAPRLVLIASGQVEDIRIVNKDFKSLTLLDLPFEVAPMFGTKVTPSALLLDSTGRIASGLATDAQGVRALLGLPKADPAVIASILAR